MKNDSIDASVRWLRLLAIAAAVSTVGCSRTDAPAGAATARLATDDAALGSAVDAGAPAAPALVTIEFEQLDQFCSACDARFDRGVAWPNVESEVVEILCFDTETIEDGVPTVFATFDAAAACGELAGPAYSFAEVRGWPPSLVCSTQPIPTRWTFAGKQCLALPFNTPRCEFDDPSEAGDCTAGDVCRVPTSLPDACYWFGGYTVYRCDRVWPDGTP